MQDKYDIDALRHTALEGRTDIITKAHREIRSQAQSILDHATRAGRDLSADENREFAMLTDKLERVADLAGRDTFAACAEHSQPPRSSPHVLRPHRQFLTHRKALDAAKPAQSIALEACNV